MAIVPNKVERFLQHTEAYGDCCGDLREEIAAAPDSDELAERLSRARFTSFCREDDVYCPEGTMEHQCMTLLLREASKGRWDAIPSAEAASLLIDPSDVWVISHIPQVVTDLEPEIERLVTLIEAGALEEGAEPAGQIAAFGVERACDLLGWKLYVPCGKWQEV